MIEADALERQMRDLINAERAEVGLDPLELELTLNVSAAAHTDWMFRTDTFAHTGQGGSSAGDRMEDAGFDFAGSWGWGENLAWQSLRGEPGIADDMADLHEALMNSPSHKANILSDGFDYVGISVELGSFNGMDAVIVTQNFAATDGLVNIDTDPAGWPDADLSDDDAVAEAGGSPGEGTAAAEGDMPEMIRLLERMFGWDMTDPQELRDQVDALPDFVGDLVPVLLGDAADDFGWG